MQRLSVERAYPFFGRKYMLISSIIHNMFFHSFQIDKWSKLVLDVLTNFICNFFGKKGKETKIGSSYLEGFLSLIGGGRS